MATNIIFRSYASADKAVCLGLFDANCPEFFAPNERVDYAEFLDANPFDYELCLTEDKVAGAFGLSEHGLQQKSLNWILLNPRSQRLGIGSVIMSRISAVALDSGASLINIAASHKSSPFFAKFGAIEIATIDNGWGSGMHRVDMELRL
ncbi:MAG: GNAT family N-acetyltransferase [Porticoccaceae bacterium]|nr:GNAT family N-acetyltransferase [Porticoccaceae bacterium]